MWWRPSPCVRSHSVSGPSRSGCTSWSVESPISRYASRTEPSRTSATCTRVSPSGSIHDRAARSMSSTTTPTWSIRLRPVSVGLVAGSSPATGILLRTGLGEPLADRSTTRYACSIGAVSTVRDHSFTIGSGLSADVSAGHPCGSDRPQLPLSAMAGASCEHESVERMFWSGREETNHPLALRSRQLPLPDCVDQVGHLLRRLRADRLQGHAARVHALEQADSGAEQHG